MISQLLTFIRNFDIVVYFFAAVGIFYGLRSFLTARQQLATSQFYRLEREQAQEKGGRAITQTVVLLEIIVLVFFLSSTTYDAWYGLDDDTSTTEESDAANDEQAQRFTTAVPVSGDAALEVPTQAADGVVLIQTPKPSPTPAGTLRPADDALGCIAEQANISLPANGQVIFETESVLGAANIQDFGYYRFEIRNVDTGGDFGVIGGATSDYTTPVSGPDGPLGSIVPQNFAPGEYRFRLSIFDRGGRWQASCEITIFISDPIPTATPLGPAPSDPLPPDSDEAPAG